MNIILRFITLLLTLGLLTSAFLLVFRLMFFKAFICAAAAFVTYHMTFNDLRKL